ncbi:MAG: hypothetical protein U1E65_12865 [Myxococcota bacterium]
MRLTLLKSLERRDVLHLEVDPPKALSAMLSPVAAEEPPRGGAIGAALQAEHQATGVAHGKRTQAVQNLSLRAAKPNHQALLWTAKTLLREIRHTGGASAGVMVGADFMFAEAGQTPKEVVASFVRRRETAERQRFALAQLQHRLAETHKLPSNTIFSQRAPSGSSASEFAEELLLRAARDRQPHAALFGRTLFFAEAPLPGKPQPSIETVVARAETWAQADAAAEKAEADRRTIAANLRLARLAAPPEVRWDLSLAPAGESSASSLARLFTNAPAGTLINGVAVWALRGEGMDAVEARLESHAKRYPAGATSSSGTAD